MSFNKVIILVLLCLPLFARGEKKDGKAMIDSLLGELPKQKEDTNKVNIFNLLARFYYNTDPNEGVKWAKQGVGLATRLNFKNGIAKAYGYWGEMVILQGGIKEGLQYEHSALKLYEETGNKHGIANCYYGISGVYKGNNYPEELNYLDSALKIYKEEDSKQSIINCYNAIGGIYTDQGDFTKALEAHKKGLALSEEINDKSRIVGCSYSIAIVYFNLGNYPESLKNCFSALKGHEELGEKFGIADCYNLIGIIYQTQGNFAEALKYLSSALTLYRKMDSKPAIGQALENIGASFFYLGNNVEALKNYRFALELYEEVGDNLGIATCYFNFGGIYDRDGNNTEALNNYLNSLKIAEKLGDKLLISKALIYAGGIYCTLKRYDDAANCGTRGLEMAKEIGSLELIKSANELLSNLYTETGNYKKSLECYKSFIAARDSLFNKENTNKILRAQMQYDFDKKEAVAKAEQSKKEALLHLKLQRKNVLIYGTVSALFALLVIGTLLIRQSRLRANQQRTELEQKQLRAQMNPHFIFNCLNSIQHFVVANDVKNANRYLSGFALLMRQTLENSKDGIITLRREIAYLENYLVLERMRFEDKFTYQITCANDVNKDTIEIPSMIIQPFIENAIRHGLCYLEDQPGELKISFYIKDKYLYCEVDDNGIGRERSKQLKIVSDLAYESRGMELTRQRLALVSKSSGAEYKVDILDKKNAAQQPSGTTIVIKFPLNT